MNETHEEIMASIEQRMEELRAIHGIMEELIAFLKFHMQGMDETSEEAIEK